MGSGLLAKRPRRARPAAGLGIPGACATPRRGHARRLTARPVRGDGAYISGARGLLVADVPVLVPAAGARRLPARAAAGANGVLARREPRLLRLGRRHVRVPDRRRRRSSTGRSGWRSAARAPRRRAARAARDRVGRAEPRAARLVQVRELRVPAARPRVPRASAIPARRSPTSRCRSASRSSPSTTSATSSTSTAATSRPLRSLVDFAPYIAFFPQLIAGPIVRYHEIADQLRDHRAAAARRLRRRLAPLRARASRRRCSSPTRRAGRRRRLRRCPEHLTTPTAWLGALAYTRADLLRLLRLLRHGDRARADVRLPLPGELRPPVLVRLDHRLLAALAHDAVALVPRLRLHPARRQSRGTPAQTLRNLCIVFVLTGALARRELDVRPLGPLPRRPARRSSASPASRALDGPPPRGPAPGADVRCSSSSAGCSSARRALARRSHFSADVRADAPRARPLRRAGR